MFHIKLKLLAIQLIILSNVALAQDGMMKEMTPTQATFRSLELSDLLAKPDSQQFSVLYYFPTNEEAAAAWLDEVKAAPPELADFRHIFVLPGSNPKTDHQMQARSEAAPLFDAAFDSGNAWARKATRATPDTKAFDEGLVLITRPDGSLKEQHVIAGMTGEDLKKHLQRIADEDARPEAIDDYNIKRKKLAIQGYDPVSYFEQNKAMEGDKAIRTQYQGVIYQFSTTDNRELFVRNPEKYKPTYGGWCATAMADGDKVKIDPEHFLVTDGRLFLFYNGWLGDARKPWVKDDKNLEAKADQAWKKLTGE
jgi:YHS domain-containing protein